MAKQGLFHAFEIGQRFGVDVLPRHFYSQVPDLQELRSSSSWRRARNMRSLRGHELGQQLQFARHVCAPAIVRAAIEQDVYLRACERNGEPGYGPIEALFLYAFVRTHKPQRIVQVGSGVSTALILLAAADAGYEPSLCCIDPFPTDYLRKAHAERKIELIARPAQDVVAESAASLQSGDLFFVDSTHTVKPGSEVNVIVLDVLPDLATGAFVHFHDITFPYDYTRGMLSGNLFFPVESALLHAFLSCNDRYEICVSLSMLHYGKKAELRECLPTYVSAGDDDGLTTSPGHFPSATYLRCRPK